jgi:hypothetical protein
MSVGHGAGSHPRERGGGRVGEQVPARVAEQTAKAPPKAGEDRDAHRPDEEVDRHRQGPIARAQKEAGQDDGQHLQRERDWL